MLNQAINKIMEEFPNARTEPFGNHSLANFIRQDIPVLLKDHFDNFPDLLWVASPGKGNWAEAPWIAAFDPLITESAQKGYYPVYLFTSSLDAVYLSFNQGMELLKKEFGVKVAREILGHRGRILQTRLRPEFQDRFVDHPIDLQPPKVGSNLELYECGHAFGKKYERKHLPPTDDLIADLTKMLGLYRTATMNGGTTELDVALEMDDSIKSDSTNTAFEEVKRYKYHRRLERTFKYADAAKNFHGYICQICEFNFEKVYGELGRMYVEAHHLTPLSKLLTDESIMKTPKDDFRVVCANCHRMIHRKGAPTSFEEFKFLYESQSKRVVDK